MKIRKNGWVSFVKFFVILGLILGLAVSIAGGILVASGSFYLTDGYDLYIGIAFAVLGTLTSLASIAMLMIYLTMAEDIRDIKNIMIEKTQREQTPPVV